MSFAFSIQAISPTAASATPHILGFSTPRTVADDTVFEIWNGSTNATLVAKVDKDGRVIGGDGTVGKPAFSFTADADSGLYRIGANNIGLAVNGAKVVDISTTGVAVTGTFSSSGTATIAGFMHIANASEATPSLAFDSDTDTGIYRIGTNNLGIAAGGTKIVDVSATGVAVTGTFTPSGAVTLGSTIRLPNATALLARNAADSADVTMFQLTSGNVITIGALASGTVAVIGGSSGTVTIQGGGAAKAIEVGADTAQPAIGFYGVTPGGQPVITGATAEAALDTLLTELAAIGLIVDNSTFVP